MILLQICPCIVERSMTSASKPERTEMSEESDNLSNMNILSQSGSIPPENDKKPSVLGRIILGITGATAVALVAITTPFVVPALRRVCLPYVPATDRQIANVLNMCRTRGTTLVDLGSGDGRVVIAAARQGFQAHGYELNPWLVWYSKIQARLQGVHSKASFSRADLWKVDLSCFDNIVIFGVSEMMPQLQHKIQAEMKDDTQVIACRFPFTNWKVADAITEGIDSVWLYRKRQSK